MTATDKREAKAAYANNPIRPDLESVAAPGGSALPLCREDIVSTVPPGTGGSYCGYPSDLAYDEYAGTSRATPHAAGVEGLLASMGCTRQQNIDVLTSTARQPVTGPAGCGRPSTATGSSTRKRR